MAKKFNLDNIKNEIDTRRQAKGQSIQEATGGGRDALLGDLVTSLNSGAPSKAVQKMKLVEGVSKTVEVAGVDAEGSGGFIAKKANSGVVAHQPAVAPAGVPPAQLREPMNEQQQGGMMPEREELYDSQVNNLINQYRTGTPAAQPYGYPQQPVQYGANGVPYLNEQQMAQMAAQQPQQYGTPQPQQGGNVLGEHVVHAVDGFMNEHFGGIVQEAMKNTIIEMYSVERVKKTLEENKDMIRSVVVEVIKELQQRKAANSGK